jgi:hypothetical protein
MDFLSSLNVDDIGVSVSCAIQYISAMTAIGVDSTFMEDSLVIRG